MSFSLVAVVSLYTTSLMICGKNTLFHKRSTPLPIQAKSAAGETLTAPEVDSVNSFGAPNTVVPKPISWKAEGEELS
jgi:hypothetical protein